MVVSISSLLLIVSLAAVTYAILTSLLTSRGHFERAKALKCQPSIFWSGNGFLGWNMILAPLQAYKEQRLPALIAQIFDDETKRAQRPVDTFCFQVLNSKGFMTRDPENMKAILGTQFKEYGYGPERCAMLEPLFGKSIFATDGELWSHSRALLRPQFTRDQVADLDLEERHLQNFLKAIPVKTDGWSDVVDIKPLFFRLTMDSATEFLLGESADSQLAAMSEYSRMSAALHESNFPENLEVALRRTSEIGWWGDFYWAMQDKAYFKACRRCHAFLDYYVEKALRENVAAKNNSSTARYIFLNELAKTDRNPLSLRYHILSVLFAGRDTTASLLSWLILLLVHHPTQFTKLRSIVIAEFGTYDRPKLENLTFAGMKACTYLQNVLSETLRLYPVVPMNTRKALQDTTLPAGGGVEGKSPIYVRKGQQVVYSVYAMHRRQDIWGLDADEFRPERWENRKVQWGWEYLPFNGGARICLGQQFALTESAFLTVRLLQRFDAIEGVDVPDAGQHVRNYLTLTSQPGNSIRVRLREARA